MVRHIKSYVSHIKGYSCKKLLAQKWLGEDVKDDFWAVKKF